jgi:cytochrome c554/c'-like protein
MQIASNSYWPRLALSVALFPLIAFAVPAAVASENEPASSAVSANASAKPARSNADSNGEPVKYIGPGSCAATSCHGSVKPVAGSRILQNEYSTWIVKDKHSHAYQALTGEIGERIARILKLNAKAEEAPKCLACHALYTTPEQRGRPFELAEGVSCENCHGPASAWLGPHTTRDWPHEKSVALGMRETRDVIHRTEKCLECHLGTKEKFVDHEMIAAGHPDLFFELDSFSAVMPRHWKSPRDSSPGKPVEDAAWTGVRDWSAGQAVQLRAEMDRLLWRAKGDRFDKKDVWPEYSELSCFACHHALVPAKDSWRQEHGFAGRRPGDPAWNASRYIVFRLLAKQIDSAGAEELDRKLAEVSGEMSKLNPERNVVAASASAAAPVAQRFAERLAAMSYDRAAVLRTLQSISDDAEAISLADERAAEQAVMAIDSLYIAYSKDAKPGNADEVRAAINELFRQLENPSAYNADQFAASLRRIGPMLR